MASATRMKIGPAKKRLENRKVAAAEELEKGEVASTTEELQKQVDKLGSISTSLKKAIEKFSELLNELTEYENDLDKLRPEFESAIAVQDDAEEIFYSIESRLNVLSKQLEHERALALEKVKHESRNKDEVNDSHVKLPKLELQKFNGDILVFQEFWDSFESSIDSNAKLREVDKLNYLRLNVEG